MTPPSFFDPAGNGSVKVKICGVTSADDAKCIAALGADAIGVNFWPKSRRFTTFKSAEPWLSDLEGVVTRIGVFVNASLDRIHRALDSGAIDAAQLHGDESTGLITQLLDRGYTVFKALGIRDEGMLKWIGDFPGDTILLDAYAPIEYGGTGEKMDWQLGRKAVESWPDRKVVLAGGLTPENVTGAIGQVGPFAVDVASGVEDSPGKKDSGKVAAFLESARR